MTGPDTRNIKINVTVDSDTRGSDKAAESLQKVDKSAGGAEKGLADLKKESERLDVQLAKTRTRVKDLENELVRTGDRATGRGSLRSRLNQERSWLRELERLAKSAATKLPEDLALNIPTKLDFSSIAGEGRGIAITGLVGIALAAAPAIGAIVAGAVAGTTVGGGIAGGVIAASADTRVRSAFKDLVSEFTSEAFAGGAFVGPVVEGLRILKDSFKGLNLDEALAKAASSVPILAQGIGDLVTNLMPGFNKVLDQSETFTKVFADGLSGVGWAISDMLGSLMATEGTIEGLHAGFILLEGAIGGTGNVLEFLGNVFHATVVGGAKVTGVLEDFVRGLENVAMATTRVLSFNVIGGIIPFGDDVHNLSNTIRGMNDSLEGIEGVGWGAAGALAAVDKVVRESEDPTAAAAENWKKFNDEFERSIDLQADYLLSQLDIEDGLQNLADLFEENGAVLNDYTQEGRDNERALIQMAQKMRAAYEKQTELTGATGEANATLEANHQRLLDQAEAAGISREAVELLIGALFRIPKLNVMGSAVTFGPSNSTFGGGLQEFATGGVVQGPRGSAQLVVAHAGEQVLTEAQQRSGYTVPSGSGMGSMGWGGGMGVSATPLVLNGSGLDSLVFEWLRTQIAARGGTLAVLGLKAA